MKALSVDQETNEDHKLLIAEIRKKKNKRTFPVFGENSIFDTPTMYSFNHESGERFWERNIFRHLVQFSDRSTKNFLFIIVRFTKTIYFKTIELSPRY